MDTKAKTSLPFVSLDVLVLDSATRLLVLNGFVPPPPPTNLAPNALPDLLVRFRVRPQTAPADTLRYP